MEKGAIIHEPLVPRTFRLLAESEKEGNGLVTYGLKDPNDNTFTHWNGSILLDDGRFYELQLECDEDYDVLSEFSEDFNIPKYRSRNPNDATISYYDYDLASSSPDTNADIGFI